MATLAIFTPQGDPTPFTVELVPMGADNAVLRIEAAFAGREVEEELPRGILERLAGGVPFVYEDLLGLRLETNGKEVRGTVSVGSGNEGFVVDPEGITRALAELG